MAELKKRRTKMNAKKYTLWVGIGCLFLTVCSMASWVSITDAAGADYPNRSISIILGVPPGGSTDMGARLLAQFMEKELKQPVVVVNKPGAAATIGGYSVVSAKPDGYTLGYFPGSGAVPEVYTYFYSAPYTSSDLRPVARIHAPVIVIAVKEDAPWNSLKELIDYARNNPGMKLGHIGKSTTQYVVMSTIIRAANLQMVATHRAYAVLRPSGLGGVSMTSNAAGRNARSSACIVSDLTRRRTADRALMASSPYRPTD